jgi:hypothetical protein
MAGSAPSEVSAESLRRKLEELCQAGPVEIWEDDGLFSLLERLHWEARQERTGVFVQFWSEDQHLNRRVLRIAEESDGHLVLDVQRFGRSRPGRLEFRVAGGRHSPQRLTRGKFRAWLLRLLQEQFPDERVEQLVHSPDLKHSFSGAYARGVMARGSRAWAVLGVSPEESADTVDAILGSGLLWLDWVREHAGRRSVEGLRLFLPGEGIALTSHRLRALVEWLRVELYIFSELPGGLQRVEERDFGNLNTWLTPHREYVSLRESARDLIERVTALAPDVIDVILRPGTGTAAREVAFRFHGLEFARWQDGRLCCLEADSDAAWTWNEVRGNQESQIARLLEKLAQFRVADAHNTRHPLYRAAAERWLESIVVRDITRVDARLDPGYVYLQVPALSGGAAAGAGRGVIDVLGVTRDGRLAVVELKASEDINFALQGADYWLRVRWHQRENDFRRYGYFAGKELQDAPPLLFLVAPGFRFHPATDVLLKYLSKEIDIVRVGLHEDWRRGLKVVFRM